MRGKGWNLFFFQRFLGITPACAGKSVFGLLYPRFIWDHPRMCGEKLQLEGQDYKTQGSPPHVRGKVPFLLCLLPKRRITPACAGKSICGEVYAEVDLDHPRMCGEKYHISFIPFGLSGSPPHVRGKGIRLVVLFATLRITPACAGKRPCPFPTARPS